MTTIATRVSEPAYRLPNWRWPSAIPAFCALCALLVGLLSVNLLNDPDTWWHLVTGNLILDTGTVPTRDPFSFTLPGTPWTAHEWLSEVALAVAFRIAGWSGVVVLAAFAFPAAVLILSRRLAQDLSGPALLAFLAVGVMLVTPSLLARPHILATPFLVAWSVGLLAAREEDRAPSAWLLPVMVMWANLHGSFTFGLALIGPFALEALLAAPAGGRVRTLALWSLFGVASLAAAAVSPHGVHGLVFPFELMSMKALASIDEWQPVRFGSVPPLEIAVGCLVGLAFRLRIRMPLIRLILLLALLHMAVTHGRHQLVLGLVGPLLLAGPLREALGPSPAQALSSWAARSRVVSAAWAWFPVGAMLAAGLALGVRLVVPTVRANGPAAPVAAVAAVPAPLRTRPVLNGYAFGGYLIFEGIRTFIDGRADMYGDTFMEDYLRLIKPDPTLLADTLSRDAIQWTIFAPGEAIVPLLDGKPGWHRIYADEYAVVHVRDGDAAAR